MSGPNPEIIKWTRTSMGYSVIEAAAKLGIQPSKSITAEEKLKSYEDGSVIPSKALLEKMSRVYSRQVTIFYLNQIPLAVKSPKDFRKVNNDLTALDQGRLKALIRDIMVRQSVIKGALEENEDLDPLAFIGSADRDTPNTLLAQRIEKDLGFSLKEYRKYTRADDAFNYIRSLIDNLGVFVFKLGNLGHYSTAISADVFRGFALVDAIAPVIVVNPDDSKRAGIFTLIHELVHLYIGVDAIDNGAIDDPVEKKCNAIAGQILFPDFDPSIARKYDVSSFHDICLLIESIAEKYRVSHTMVAYKLYESQVISINVFLDLKDHYYSYWKQQTKSEKEKRLHQSAPTTPIVKRSEVGREVMNVVRSYLYNGTLTISDAALLLGTRPAGVQTILGYQ